MGVAGKVTAVVGGGVAPSLVEPGVEVENGVAGTVAVSVGVSVAVSMVEEGVADGVPASAVEIGGSVGSPPQAASENMIMEAKSRPHRPTLNFMADANLTGKIS